jgi:hypothetical protein
MRAQLRTLDYEQGAAALTPAEKVQVFVRPAYVEQDYKISAKRTDQGFELSGGQAVAVGLVVSSGSLKAWAGIKGNLGFGVKADSAAECVDLLLLPLYTWMSSQTPTLYDVLFSPQFAALKALGGVKWLADSIFGDNFDERVLAMMDPDSKGDGADTFTFEGGIGLDAGGRRWGRQPRQ